MGSPRPPTTAITPCKLKAAIAKVVVFRFISLQERWIVHRHLSVRQRLVPGRVGDRHERRQPEGETPVHRLLQHGDDRLQEHTQNDGWFDDVRGGPLGAGGGVEVARVENGFGQIVTVATWGQFHRQKHSKWCRWLCVDYARYLRGDFFSIFFYDFFFILTR